MKKWIISEFGKPIIRRLGTALAVYLGTQGIGEDTISQIVTGLTAVALVGTDLLLSYRARN